MAAARLLRSPVSLLPHASPVERNARRALSEHESAVASCRFLTGATSVKQLRRSASGESSGRRAAGVLTTKASLRSPRGFGPKPQTSPKKKSSSTSPKKGGSKSDPDEDKTRRPDVPEEDEEEDDDDDTVPEIVTNRMLSRISFTVGIPLAIGLLFFPFFYWLKVVQKVDVPDWVPYSASIVSFGAAAAGISYGIVSTSWDPRREGTLLGWKEARVNWPIFLATLNKKKG